MADDNENTQPEAEEPIKPAEDLSNEFFKGVEPTHEEPSEKSE